MMPLSRKIDRVDDYDQMYGDALGPIDVPAMGHSFSDGLICDRRSIQSVQTVYTWEHRTMFHYGFKVYESRRFRKPCGYSWHEHQVSPHPCNQSQEYSDGAVRFPAMIYCKLTRATKWSRIYAASRLPRD